MEAPRPKGNITFSLKVSNDRKSEYIQLGHLKKESKENLPQFLHPHWLATAGELRHNLADV